MKPSVRIPLLLLVMAVALSLGVAGVHAATQCVRFIEKAHHHKVSAATAARWKAWDKAHPNWHPKKTPRETLAELDFACAVPLIATPVEEQLPPLELTAFKYPMDALPPPTDNIRVTAVLDTVALDPLTVAGQSTSDVSPPIYAPQYPGLFGGFPPPQHAVVPPLGLAPEPSSWILLGTSVLAMGILSTRRRQVANAFARR